MRVCSRIIRSPGDTGEDKPWREDKDFRLSADVTAGSLVLMVLMVLMDVFNA
jgi:hypothetical protein